MTGKQHSPSDSRARTLRLILFFTIAFTLAAHGYRYLSMSFSGDSMLLSQVGEEAYQTSLGRFLQPVYWQIRGYITAPLLIGLFATAFLILSLVVIADLLQLTQPLPLAICCGVLAASETLAISNATYLPWTDVYMLALLFAVLGVYVSEKHRYGFLISPLLYCLSLGLYQSYLPAASTLIILLLMLDTLRGKPAADIWRRGLTACASLFAGLLLYALVLKVILFITGGQASTDYNGVGRVGLPPLSEIPGLLMGTFLTPISLLFIPGGNPMSWHISTVPVWLNHCIFLPAAVLFFHHAARLSLAAKGTLAFLAGVLPLGMNFVHFISGGISSGLTIFSYNLLYLLPVALLCRSEGSRRLIRLCRTVCAGALCLLLALNIRTSNEMALKRDLEFSATTSAMARVLDRAEQTQGYIPGETPVVILGMLPSSAISMEKPGFESIAKAQGMRYTYGASYETSNYWYLQMALGEPINLVSHAKRQEMAKSVKGLSPFPNDGCCRMLDGVLYLRIN